MTEGAAPQLFREVRELHQREPRPSPFGGQVRGPQPGLLGPRSGLLEVRKQRGESLAPQARLERVDLFLHELAHRFAKAPHPPWFREVHPPPLPAKAPPAP